MSEHQQEYDELIIADCIKKDKLQHGQFLKSEGVALLFYNSTAQVNLKFISMLCNIEYIFLAMGKNLRLLRDQLSITAIK